MEGANTGHSNEDEEANPPDAPHDADNQHRNNLIAHTTKGAIHSTQRAFGPAAPTSNYSTTPGKPPTPSSGTAVPTDHRSTSSRNAERPSHPQPKLHRKNCS
jgi:hypothetical protein